MKRCSPKGWCTVMQMVLTEQVYGPAGFRIAKHPGHNDGVIYRLSEDAAQDVDLSLCPWCGASLLPKPVVVATKYRGKR